MALLLDYFGDLLGLVKMRQKSEVGREEGIRKWERNLGHWCGKCALMKGIYLLLCEMALEGTQLTLSLHGFSDVGQKVLEEPNLLTHFGKIFFIIGEGGEDVIGEKHL